MIPDSHVDLLSWEAKSFAHVATIGPAGEPHTSPVWFEWDGSHIKFSLTTGRQKYRNLQRDKRVSLSIIDPGNAYRYIEIRGELDRSSLIPISISSPGWRRSTSTRTAIPGTARATSG